MVLAVMEADVAVVGAGPAGLMAAASAADGGATVVLLEHMEETGRKLLASGGGRCNFTNTDSLEKLIAAYGRSADFVRPALSRMDNAGLRSFFDGIGDLIKTGPTNTNVMDLRIILVA